jgi:hypothetical protein
MIFDIRASLNELALEKGIQSRLTIRPAQKVFGARLKYGENSRKQKVTEGNSGNKMETGERNLETYGNRLKPLPHIDLRSQAK